MSTSVNNQSSVDTANTTAPIDPRGNNIYEVAVVATSLNDLGEATGLALEGAFAESNGTADGIDTIKLRSNVKFASSLGQLSVDLNNPLFANIENVDISLTGDAKLNLIGNNESNVLTGNAADNFIEGGGGDDVLNGGAGNDSLDGGTGADALFGGTGNDTYVIDTLATGFDETGKVIAATLADTFTENDAQGVDTVRLRGELLFADSMGKVALDLGNPLFANIENLDVSETGRTKLDLIGNRENNLLIGNAADNYMTGGGGKNTLIGGAGNDTLDSGSAGSQDLLFGGAGDDTYIIDIELRKLTDANGVKLQNPNKVQITVNDYFIEDDIAAGGNDTLKVNFAGDSAYQYEAELEINLKDKLPGIENLDISGITGVNTKFRLNATDNGSQLIGRKDGDNTFFGGKGDDTLIGGDKNDYLFGGLGKDYLFGGAGNDSLNGTSTSFGVSLGSSYRDTLVGGEGNDYYSVELKVTEVDALKNVVAYELLDTIIEESGSAGGLDTIYISVARSESYEKITIDMNDGKFANIENISIYHSGGDASKANILGNSGDNTLSSTGKNNLIDGGAGNDILYGDSYGNDTLLGGAGNDTLIGGYSSYSSGKDFFYGGEGDDLLNTKGGNHELFGESGDDKFETRFDANPTISGGVGADTFVWDVTNFYWEPFRIDTTGTGNTVISDFSLAEGDKLDLRDCLIGEDGDDVTRLLDYLDVKVDAGNTLVTISAFGQLNNSQYTSAVAEDIRVTMQGVDLFAATGTTSESALLQTLLTNKNLIVDV